MNHVFITAFSSISSLGLGIEETCHNISLQQQWIHLPEPNDKYKKPYFSVNYDRLLQFPGKVRCSVLTLNLLELIKNSWQKFQDIPIFFATSTGGILETEDVFLKLVNNSIKYPLFKRHFFSTVYQDVLDYFPLYNFEFNTFSTACSSSGHSILQAYRMIKEGIITRALIVSADVLCQTTMIGFDSLKLVSATGTQPLTELRDGLSLGEGGGIFLLETEPDTKPVAEIIGGFSNSDGYHISSPDPEGKSQLNCILNALTDAGLTPENIDYINAHGTGTPMNDEVEMKIIKTVFTHRPVVTSTKAFIGHTLGASCILDAAIVLGMLKNEAIYQPKGLSKPMDEDYIPAETVYKSVRYFLKNSFGFGGNNVSLIFKIL